MRERLNGNLTLARAKSDLHSGEITVCVCEHWTYYMARNKRTKQTNSKNPQ